MKKTEKIPLLNFETKLDNDLLLKAESLFDSGKLLSLKQDSKGIFDGVVMDEENFSVRVGLYKENIEKVACSCGSKKNICEHLICAFFGVRHADISLSAIKTEKKTRRKGRSSGIKQLLNEVNPAELKRFISHYAARDKRFSLMLQTHFARKFSEINGYDTYEEILNKSFPVIGDKSSNTHKTRNLQLLKGVSNELLVHIRDALSLEQYMDAFYMIHALTRKLAYAIHFSDNPPDAHLELFDSAHKYYADLLSGNLAPTLRHKILDEIIELLSTTFYHWKGKNNLLSLIEQNHPNEDQKDKLKEILAGKYFNSISTEYKVFLLAHLIRLNSSIEEEVGFWYEEQFKDVYILSETVTILIHLRFESEIPAFLNRLKANDLLEEKTYQQLMLKYFLFVRDDGSAMKVAISLFEKTGDFEMISRIKTISGKKWKSHYEKIMKNLLKKKEEKSFSMALSLSYREMDLKKMLSLLDSRQDVNLFIEYDKVLVHDYKDYLFDYYKKFLLAFNKDHAGLKAVKRTHAILDHLNKIGMGPETTILQKVLLKEYPERKSLQMML